MKQLMSIILTGLVFFMISCEKKDVDKRPFPRVKTLDVTNINEEGAVFNGELIRDDTHQILDYGFLWDTRPNPTTENAEKFYLELEPEAGSFSLSVPSTLRQGEIYNVRAVVKTNDYTILGNVVEFESKGSGGPVIENFYPQSGMWGDTVTIEGAFFSTINENNTVIFGEAKVSVIQSSNSMLRFIVPAITFNEDVNIAVEVAGNQETIAQEKFSMVMPEIETIEPLSVYPSDTITIYGDHFHAFSGYNRVLIGESATGYIFDLTSTEIRCIVPESISSGQYQIKLISAGRTTTFGQPLTVLAP